MRKKLPDVIKHNQTFHEKKKNMSKTPVLTLTKKQQKSTLSAKKTKTKETLRNVLASPYSKYWPVISIKQYQRLKNILNQCLPKLLPTKVKIPWSQMKDVSRTERNKFREQYTLEHYGSDYLIRNIETRDGLILGINDVTKSLENEKAKSVLITEDISPQLMVEHIIDQAVLLGIPVLVIPELRTILKEKCGFPSSAVAFTDSPKYKLVQDAIVAISTKFPVPKNHINFNRAPKVTNDSIIIIEDSFINDLSQVTTVERSKKTTAILADGKEGDVELPENVHLIRTTKNKRVFIPEKSSEEHNTIRMDVDSSGFLAFSAETPKKQTVEKKYVSLKVSKIKGDRNRSKRKIQDLKEKRSKQKSKKFT